MCSVGECDLDNRLPPGQPTLELFIGDELNFRALTENCWILHARLVVRRLERGGLVNQHHRHHVLEADIRHLAVVHGLGFVDGHSHDDLLHLLGLEGAPLPQDLYGVKWRLDGRSDGPFLDVCPRDLVAFPELLD